MTAETTIDQLTATEGRPLIDGIPQYGREVEALNQLLRGELSALETYDECIERLDNAQVVSELKELRRSHELRTEQLHHHIKLMGGEPEESSGAWGLIARALETGATMFGSKAALEILERGELHGVREYHDVTDLEPETMKFIVDHLRPEQSRTREKVAELRHRFE